MKSITKASCINAVAEELLLMNRCFKVADDYIEVGIKAALVSFPTIPAIYQTSPVILFSNAEY